jgi:hypothetical protein
MTTTQTPNTATYTVVNEMEGPTEFSVHAPGCKHLKNLRCNGKWARKAATAAEVVAVELAGELGELGWEAHNFRVMPCAAKA